MHFKKEENETDKTIQDEIQRKFILGSYTIDLMLMPAKHWLQSKTFILLENCSETPKSEALLYHHFIIVDQKEVTCFQ